MIQTRTKIQLLVFALITMVGVTFVGAKYARLDRLILDTSYQVTAHFADSGGIFAGAEVSYRGVTVGRVGELRLSADGVDVVLDIEKDSPRIPAEARALVANRSAVGEQYVDLMPETASGPYLEEGSEIPQEMTGIPISSTKWLLDTDRLVESVNKDSLRTVVDEFGAAFAGTGPDLARIIDTSGSFIKTANENFDVTTALIKDSNVVLASQVDKASSIQSFARNLALFSGTLATSDADLRRIIASGSATANQLRAFLEENNVPLGQLINNLVTTGEITVRHLDGIRMVLIMYPYAAAAGYVVVDKTPKTGLFDAHFGLILTQEPAVCHQGYEGTDVRPPQDTGNRPMAVGARCTEPQSKSNARGGQWAPRAEPGWGGPVVATYDRSTGRVTYTDTDPNDSVTYTGGAAATYGEDSWKWLLLQPLAPREE